MGRQLAEWSARVRTLLGNPGDDQIDPTAIDDHVRAAVRRFSSDHPRLAYADFVGDGVSFDFAVSSLTGWSQGFSEAVAIESPQGGRDPYYIDMNEVSLYPADTSPTAVRLRATTPSAGQVSRVFYTVPWPIPDSNPATDKIADTDYEPVCSLAGSYACQQLASTAAGTGSPTLLEATAVDYGGEAERWRSRGAEMKKMYDDHLGGGEAAGPASGWTDWDALSTFWETGHRFLYRWRR